MIINFYSDGEKRDKVAEFYDTVIPTLFMRGVLEEAKDNERDTQYTFTVRQEPLKQKTAWDEVVERSHE